MSSVTSLSARRNRGTTKSERKIRAAAIKLGMSVLADSRKSPEHLRDENSADFAAFVIATIVTGNHENDHHYRWPSDAQDAFLRSYLESAPLSAVREACSKLRSHTGWLRDFEIEQAKERKREIAALPSTSHEPKLRGDAHPTRAGLINLLEHATQVAENGDTDEARKFAALAARATSNGTPIDEARATVNYTAIEIAPGVELMADLARVDQPAVDEIVSRCRAEAQAGESRRTEKLIALWHYETERGCSIHEHLPDLFELAQTAINSISPGDEDMTDDEMVRADRDARRIADHILLALVEGGHYDRALAYVEHTADMRRECDAQYGSPREIPFGRTEWEGLIRKVGRMDSSGSIRTGAVQS